MSSHNLNEPLVTYSDPESKRFGMRVFRGTINDINEKLILSAIIENEVDLAILRLPASKQYQISRLEKTGLPYIVADTLVYYSVDLRKYVPRPMKNNSLVFRSCTVADIDIMNTMVQKIFASYNNHYISNPYIKRKDMVDGYKEWACSYIMGDKNNQIAWIIENNHEDVGFAACRYDQFTIEWVLSGILPNVSGNGIFTDITRFIQHYFKDLGYSRMITPTQVQNFASQKIWKREGLDLSEAYITIHINSFMNSSVKEIETIDSEISYEEIEEWGEINNIHKFDVNKGIPHRFILDNFFKYIRSVLNEQETQLLSYTYQFLKPLYLKERCKVLISVPIIDEKTGIVKLLYKILDQKNNLCMFLYCDLIKNVSTEA